MSQPTMEAVQQRLDTLQRQKKELEAKISREHGRLRERERKARTRRLIEYGGLVAIAELDTEDPGMVLGMMLEGAQRLREDETICTQWKTKGDRVLAERVAASSKAASSTQPEAHAAVAQNGHGASMHEQAAE